MSAFEILEVVTEGLVFTYLGFKMILIQALLDRSSTAPVMSAPAAACSVIGSESASGIQSSRLNRRVVPQLPLRKLVSGASRV